MFFGFCKNGEISHNLFNHMSSSLNSLTLWKQSISQTATLAFFFLEVFVYREGILFNSEKAFFDGFETFWGK